MELKGLEKNKLFLESYPTPMWLCDPKDFSIVEVNDRALDLYGYSKSEMLSLSLEDLWASNQLPDSITTDSLPNNSTSRIVGMYEHLDKQGNSLFLRISTMEYQANGKKYRLLSAQNVAPLKQAEQSKEYHAAQQRACAELGLKALKLNDIQALFDEASRIVTNTLDNKYCKILQYVAKEDYFLVRSVAGWDKSLIGTIKVETGEQSHPGYALMNENATVVEDLEKEERFTDEFLSDKQDIKSGIATVIPGIKKPYGVLATHSSQQKMVTENDIIFLTTVANILGGAFERMNTQNVVHKRARQQAVTAELGRIAVNSDDLDQIFDTATHVVAQTLGNQFSKVLKLLPDEGTLLLKAGTGYDNELIGNTKIETKEGSHAGFTLLSNQPVIVTDLDHETRFTGSKLLQKNNIRSGISVVIYGRNKPYGILETHSTLKKNYSKDEIIFVETVAHFLGDTIERIHAENNYKRLNRELEETVQQRTQALEKVNKELEAFSYNVSHDLRAPLRAISGYTSLLLEDYYEDMPKDGKEFLEIINDETHKMGMLIDDLLSFSRMNRKERRPQHFDMQVLVDECIEQIQQANPEVRAKYDIGELPEVYADRNLIRQVWMNLLGNAVKYRKPGRSPQICIQADIDSDKEQHVFSIEDNGVGFNMKYADKLFGVFERLHSDDEFEGTGIGLALAQRIINRHDGQIWADSELDKGTTMFFSLPMKQNKNSGVN